MKKRLRDNSFVTPMFASIYGMENIGPNQSYVIVANHQSQYDIFLVYEWLPVEFKWVMKSELRHVPIIGTKDILPDNTIDLFPGRAKLVIHRPIPIDGYGEGNIEELMDKARESIQKSQDQHA